MRKGNIWVLLALLFSVSGYGQSVTFEDFPLPSQLYQRNVQTNMATIPVKGFVSTSGYTQVRVQVTNEQGQQVTLRSQNISYTGGRANFQLSINIPAARNNHEVTIEGLRNGTWDNFRTVDKILAGDIYIINGQSNAQAAAAPHEDDVDEYTRSWFALHGWGTLNLSYPGLWGARLAKNISVDQNLPISIFNQAVGAEPIKSYLPTVGGGNYASLQRRFEDANMANPKIRAAFWFHGEANAYATSTEEYVEDFTTIKQAWERDYNIDHTFVFQMRYGSCTSQTADILEAHRVIGATLPNTVALSTTNANHDDCHFYYDNGYRDLGDRMSELTKNKLYGGNNNLAYSADITSVNIANNNDRKLVLEFDGNQSLKTIGSFPYQDFKLEFSNASIIGGRIIQSRIELDLDQPIQDVSGLTYLSHIGYTPGWITNQANVGIFTFHDFPIANAPTTGQTCNANYSVNGQQLSISNVIAPIVTIAILKKSDYSQLYSCSTWGTPCDMPTNVNLAPGEYFVQIKSYRDNGNTPICDIFEEFSVGGTTPTYDCPSINANIGDSCNDGNPNTTNDTVQNNCTCAGTVPPPTYDCPTLNANIGDSCNDGNPNTTNDVVQNNCTCTGTVPQPTYDCPNLNANIGDSCNDGNPNTTNDVVTDNCFCVGTVPPPTYDCPTLNANIGDACNDGNPNTTNDVVQNNCTCSGTTTPPPSGCNASYSVSNNVISFQNVDAPVSFVKILKNDFSTEYECNTWSSMCQANFTHTINQLGTYYVQLQTHQNWTSPADCNVFETITITTLGGGGNPGTCNNITNGGFITGNEEICPDEIPTPFVNSTFPSGGSGTIEYRWLRQSGSCPSVSSEVIPGATQSSYTPGPVSETTYFRRQSRRVGCTSWTVGESNCVVKYVPNNCNSVTPPNTDPCGVSYSISGNQLIINGLDFPITSVKVQNAQTYADVFSCNDWSNQCSNQTSVSLPSGEFILVIQTFEDWSTPLCNINEMISVNSSRQGIGSNNFIKEKSSANPESVYNLSLNVFPNPASEVLNIGLENYLGKDVDLRLMDQLGKVHATKSILQNRNNVITFPIDNVGNGMYLLVVKTKDEKPVIKKVLIKKG